MATRSRSLRRRDRHLVLIVGAVALCNVATSALYWVAVRARLREPLVRVAAVETALDEVRADVSAVDDATRVLVRAVARSLGAPTAPDAVPDAEPVERPVAVGRGTTKNHRGERYAWVDYRIGTGAVERAYLPIPSPPPTAFVDAKVE